LAPVLSDRRGESRQSAACILAHFALCPEPRGRHIIAVALAHDDHRPCLVDGKRIAAFITVTK